MVERSLESDPRVEQANLAALARIDPDLAGRIEHLPADLIVEPAVTRDGRSSFRIASADDQPAWFGRTSIPAIRAAALLEQFDTGQGNVLLPGIGEGTEVTLLLARLGHHRAVFVWEPDAANIRLALRLHDWSAHIARGRLLFIVCPFENLAVGLADWLDRHPGYFCPDRILMWPWVSLADLAGFRSAVQAAYEVIDQRRTSALDQVARMEPPAGMGTESADSVESVSLDTGVAVLSLSPRDEIWKLADSVACAARDRGWPAASVDIRSPADRHPLARARRLREELPEGVGWAILLDATRKDLEQVLPDSVPAVSWLGPHATIDAHLKRRIGPRDLIVLTNDRLWRRVQDNGVEPGRTLVCPHPCLAEAEMVFDPAAPRPAEVTILADLAPARAEALGLTLGTHVQVWETAVELLRARIDTFTDQEGEAILAAAEKKLKTSITDTSARWAMCAALSGPVANTLLWQSISQHLVNNDISVSIWGRGWPGSLVAHWRGEAALLDERRSVVARAMVVLAADVTGDVSPTTLLAAGSGAVVVARAHPADQAPGGLASLLAPGQECVMFRRLAEIPKLVRSFLSDPQRRESLVWAAVARCRGEHSSGARLEAIEAATSIAFRSCPGLS